MTARLESIGRISEKGLDTVREKLLGKDDLLFFKIFFKKSDVKISYFDQVTKLYIFRHL